MSDSALLEINFKCKIIRLCPTDVMHYILFVDERYFVVLADI